MYLGVIDVDVAEIVSLWGLNRVHRSRPCPSDARLVLAHRPRFSPMEAVALIGNQALSVFARSVRRRANEGVEKVLARVRSRHLTSVWIDDRERNR